MNIIKLKKFYFSTIPVVFIVFGFVLLIFSFAPLIIDEGWYYFIRLKNQKYVLDTTGQVDNGESIFSKFLGSQPIMVVPVNKDFSIVIEKIGVNAPIVKDVGVSNEDAYKEALKLGVAHAASSSYPTNPRGNVYLFAHASLNFWNLGKYATVFNLLRKLEIGDTAHVFFEGKDYVYSVVNVETLSGWDTRPLTRAVIEPLLTLQTCDPPGTTLNRLVVTAKFVEVK